MRQCTWTNYQVTNHTIKISQMQLKSNRGNTHNCFFHLNQEKVPILSDTLYSTCEDLNRWLNEYLRICVATGFQKTNYPLAPSDVQIGNPWNGCVPLNLGGESLFGSGPSTDLTVPFPVCTSCSPRQTCALIGGI